MAMKKSLALLLWLTAPSLPMVGTNYYVSPAGDACNGGTSPKAPLASLATAQKKVAAGDTVFILPGTYHVKPSEMMDTVSDSVWDVVFDFATSGTAASPIVYRGVQDAHGRRPVFDLSGVSTGKRITGFYVHADYLRFSNIEVVGITVPKSSKNTQSENFRVNGGNHCTFDNIAAHDGMGIGFYIMGRSGHNVITNCDAYNNFDAVNIGVDNGANNGGNSDGFGCHVKAGCEGNTFRYCRAWQNSDDGFDFISCRSAAKAEYCIAFRNGYDKDGVARANGNGFKAGGYGMRGDVHIKDVPMHVVSHCLAAENKANGFFSNHHLGGVRFEHNAAYSNRMLNYSLANRKGKSHRDAVDVPGYGHVIRHNTSYGNKRIANAIDAGSCSVSGNTFSYAGGKWVDSGNIQRPAPNSIDASQLSAARNADGSLPPAILGLLAGQ